MRDDERGTKSVRLTAPTRPAETYNPGRHGDRSRTCYRVESTTNLNTPIPGQFITAEEAESLRAYPGVKVTTVAPSRTKGGGS